MMMTMVDRLHEASAAAAAVVVVRIFVWWILPFVDSFSS
jgi:hypothetical protein